MIITITDTDVLMCNPKGTVGWGDIANELTNMGCVMRQIRFEDENVIVYQFDVEGDSKRIELAQEDFVLLNHATIVRVTLWNW